jgi:hypothetical protein
MNNEDLQQLKALALAATPGPWEWDGVRSEGEYGSDDDGGCGYESYQVTTNAGACIVDCLNNDNGAVHVEHDGHAWDKVAKQDAKYIAAASPDVVLALIARIESLAADAERYKWLRNDNAYFPEEELIRGGIELDQAIDAAIAKEKA